MLPKQGFTSVLLCTSVPSIINTENTYFHMGSETSLLQFHQQQWSQQISHLFNFFLLYTKCPLCSLCKSSWPELRGNSQRVWKQRTWCETEEDRQCWHPHTCRGDSCEQTQAWAAIRGRMHIAAVNLPVNDKDIETGILSQNTKISKYKILYSGLRDAVEKENKAQEEQTGRKSE